MEEPIECVFVFFWQGFSSQKSGWKEQGKDIRDESAEKG